jgi:hypothetical protein
VVKPPVDEDSEEKPMIGGMDAAQSAMKKVATSVKK